MNGSTGNELGWKERLGGFTLALLFMVFQSWIMGPGVIMLTVGLAVSFVAWAFGPWSASRASVLPLYGAGVVLQIAHFAEEYRTGFHEVFPALLGYPSWTPAAFVRFNLGWLVTFVIAGIAAARGSRLAYLIVIFLALVGLLGNGLFHLGIAIFRGGYFPGAVTAPLQIILGFWLLRRLYDSRRLSSEQART